MPLGLFQKRSLKHFARTVVLTSLVLTGILAATRQLGLFESMELDAYDQFLRLKPADPIDERILVVGVSEADIQNRQEYPLEDGTLADLLEKLEVHSPRTIGIDIARDVPQGPEAGRDRLIKILESSDHIVSACLLSSAGDPGVPAAPGTAPDLVGFADFPEDIGGIIRRSILISAPAPPPVLVGEPHVCNDADPENEVLSLSFLLSLIYLEQEDIFPDQTPWGELALGDTLFGALSESSGGYARTGASDYQVMLNYRAPRSAVRQVTLTDVLEDSVDPSWITDRIVLIGYTSQVANDILLTPYNETTSGFRGMPGVVIHAQATSQILSTVLDDRPLIYSWPELAEIAWIWFCSLLGGSLAFYNRRMSLFLLGCLGLLAAYWGLCFGLFLQGLWLPLVPAAFGFVATAAAVGVLDQASQGGYAQAIYEQLQDQLRGRSQANQSAQKADYLEDLVRRARAIRQRRDGEALLNSEALTEAGLTGTGLTGTGLTEDPMQAQFESPEMQTLYEQIKAKAQQDWENERAEVEAAQTQHKIAAQEQRIKTLIHKAQTARGETMEGYDG